MRVIEKNGRFGVDYDEGADAETGKRRRRFVACVSEADAYRTLANLLDSRYEPEPDPAHLLGAFSAKFIADCRARGLEPSTVERYEGSLRNHILPELGNLPLQSITREVVHDFLKRKLEAESLQGLKENSRKRASKKLERGSVRQLLTTIRALFSVARFTPELAGLPNPCEGLAKRLRLSAKHDEGEVKALTREQLARLLGAAREGPHYAALALMAWAGLRLGEALAVQESDIDFSRSVLMVSRTLGSKSTKGKKSRIVDVSRHLLDVLRDVVERNRDVRRSAKVVALDGSTISPVTRGPYLLYPEIPAKVEAKDKSWAQKIVQRAMTETLKVAGLPEHFTCHSLRHTYAANLISAGVSAAYVQRQMGHASISLTVDLYGRWFPVQGNGAVDDLSNSTLPTLGAEMEPETDSSGLEQSPQVVAVQGVNLNRRGSYLRSPCTCTSRCPSSAGCWGHPCGGPSAPAGRTTR
ncbi:MAG: site-specific integrase [Vicinamibacteria bacterium]|nr:site-specific integrase [Vicinamibacteria bacterium]